MTLESDGTRHIRVLQAPAGHWQISEEVAMVQIYMGTGRWASPDGACPHPEEAPDALKRAMK